MATAQSSIALVTGASRGIGRAIARRLAREHEVIAVARSERGLREAAEEIEREGGRCRPLALDVSDAAAVERALAGVQVDVLVNNAGVGPIKPLLELSPDEWHRMVGVNFNALFYVTRALLPEMIRRGGGHVVNIGSLAGRNAIAGGTGYSGTKHAVVAFTESLMLEVRHQHVRVSIVMPGSVDTGFGGRGRGGAGDASWKLSAEDVAEAVAFAIGQPANAHVSRIEMRPSMPPSRG